MYKYSQYFYPIISPFSKTQSFSSSSSKSHSSASSSKMLPLFPTIILHLRHFNGETFCFFVSLTWHRSKRVVHDGSQFVRFLRFDEKIVKVKNYVMYFDLKMFKHHIVFCPPWTFIGDYLLYKQKNLNSKMH